MNWFQRYGIPGAYFFGLTFSWLYTCYGCTMRTTNLTVVMGAVVAGFLPIGYIIRNLQQLVYLKCKRLGVHRNAFKKAGIKCLEFLDEPTLEAASLLAVTQKWIVVDFDSHKFMQDWIRKRMDVIAINSSLIVATILAVIIALLIPRFCLGWSFQFAIAKVVLLGFISSLLLLLTGGSIKVLRDQIIEVIAGLYNKG